MFFGTAGLVVWSALGSMVGSSLGTMVGSIGGSDVGLNAVVDVVSIQGCIVGSTFGSDFLPNVGMQTWIHGRVF